MGATGVGRQAQHLVDLLLARFYVDDASDPEVARQRPLARTVLLVLALV